MSVLNCSTLNFEKKPLFVPPIDEALNVLENGLQNHFESVSVRFIDCPDLKEPPFHLIESGLTGNPILVEVGGVPYLHPMVDRSKYYDIVDMCNKVADEQQINKYFAVGAGAGPWTLINSNCEGIFNLKVENKRVVNDSYLAYVDEKKECVLQNIPNDVTTMALLGNFFLSDGKPGKVINIKCSKRIGSDDFIASIRKTLAEFYMEKTVGLGGVFLLKKGSAKQHVMQDFSKTPIHTDEELNNWLKFYNMDAVLIALGTLVTNDAGLDLRVQHFHSFSKHGVGGHYHIDTTPDIVEYEGFFTLGEKIVRVDRPVSTHLFGRD